MIFIYRRQLRIFCTSHHLVAAYVAISCIVPTQDAFPYDFFKGKRYRTRLYNLGDARKYPAKYLNYVEYIVPCLRYARGSHGDKMQLWLEHCGNHYVVICQTILAWDIFGNRCHLSLLKIRIFKVTERSRTKKINVLFHL